MLDERTYITKVNATIETLRAICLGQNIQLVDVLSQHMKEKSEKEQAEHLASQLLFALVTVAGKKVSSKEQQARSWQWLEDIIQYLLDETCEEDHTFFQLLQILKCSKEVREILFANRFDKNHELCSGEPPELLNSLETAIWWLLGVQGKQCDGKGIREKLDLLCGGNT
ncbi:MAG: hypothetical protein E7446_04620 [Ruminococcaceae bacterium]|nr:hypothetical protein [Oscillospiraceae bacterium]